KAARTLYPAILMVLQGRGYCAPAIFIMPQTPLTWLEGFSLLFYRTQIGSQSLNWLLLMLCGWPPSAFITQICFWFGFPRFVQYTSCFPSDEKLGCLYHSPWLVVSRRSSFATRSKTKISSKPLASVTQ